MFRPRGGEIDLQLAAGRRIFADERRDIADGFRLAEVDGGRLAGAVANLDAAGD